MALVSSGLIHQEGSRDSNGIGTYQEVYEVIVDDDDRLSPPGTIALYVTGDVFTSTYTHDTTARLKKKTATQQQVREDGGIVWHVTLDYDSNPTDVGLGSTAGSGSPGTPSGTPGSGSSATVPTARPTQVSVDTVEVEELMTKDLDNNPVAASNGQPFNPPIKVTRHRVQLTIVAWKAANAEDYSKPTTYVGKVNNNDWWGFPTETVLCKKYSLVSQYEHGAWYWQKTVVVEINPAGWTYVDVLDAGTYELCSEGDGFVIIPIKDAEGNPVADPVPLDGEGHALYNSQCVGSGGGEEQYKSFRVYQTADFSSLI
jgi:hypothetical protein